MADKNPWGALRDLNQSIATRLTVINRHTALLNQLLGCGSTQAAQDSAEVIAQTITDLKADLGVLNELVRDFQGTHRTAFQSVVWHDFLYRL